MQLSFSAPRASRLSRLVERHLPFVRRNYLQKLFRTKEIKVAGRPAKPDQIVEKGTSITVFLPDPRENFDKLTGCRIIFEDDDVMAFDKKAGITCVPGVGTRGASLHEAAEQLLETRFFPVHRLDRETSGVIVFSKSMDMAKKLELEFRERRTEKIYYALVAGTPKKKEEWIRDPLRRNGEKVIIDPKRGQSAETHFEWVKKIGPHALLKVEPTTGRTHQIRVHLASIGCPVVGDAVYGKAKANINRHLLHAGELKILNYRFQATLPPEFEREVSGD